MDQEFARKAIGSKRIVPEQTGIYRTQVEDFRRKFGREMGPDDPFFFDPEADTPQFRAPADAEIAIDLLARLMGEAGIDAAAIYAFKKTGGLFPSPELSLSAEERIEWNAAVYEYEERLAGSKAQ